MKLHLVDWFFIAGYCAVAFGIGVYFSKRAGSSIGEFFIAGRNLPWWGAGTSIVATTFAADTPLAVSGFVRRAGIYENWFWWNGVMGGMLCVFFYARLWRRAGILTDNEFIELRYDGRSASALRGFMAVYGGVLQNCIVMGWVMLAMLKICDVMLGWPKITTLVVLLLIALGYTVLSGFWGVVVTDLLQFAMAMTGSVALAGILIWKMGGPAGMVAQISAAPDFDPRLFDMVPDFATAAKLALVTFVVQVAIQWWGGGQGGGYLAQRLFATRSERDSVLAVLWYNIAHFVLRPWPWIIVGLASVAYFTEAQLLDPATGNVDYERAYPMMMAEHLPTGLRGLMVASLLAAFMSTMDTQLNWGASYLVNDLYKRFIRPEATERHYVTVSRLAMPVLLALAALTAWQAVTISGAWIYLATLTAGAGFVGLLRWYWWRVNPWSEITALVSSFIIANGEFWCRGLAAVGLLSDAAMHSVSWFYSSETYAIRFTVIIAVCTVVWVAVTYLTQPASRGHLERFSRQVRPGGWWAPLAQACPEVRVTPARTGWLGWFLGVACIYAGLFGIGCLCLGRTAAGIGFLVVAAVSGWLLVARAPGTEPGADEVE